MYKKNNKQRQKEYYKKKKYIREEKKAVKEKTNYKIQRINFSEQKNKIVTDFNENSKNQLKDTRKNANGKNNRKS